MESIDCRGRLVGGSSEARLSEISGRDQDEQGGGGRQKQKGIEKGTRT